MPLQLVAPPQSGVYTVSALLDAARALVDDAFPVLVVEGEISNLARPSSGHYYFTLKDQKAQIRCALFRNRQATLLSPPRNGQLVRARARLGVYPARGEIQLIVEHLEDAGEGALRKAFEALRAKLEAEGLFEPQRRRLIPSMPKRVALITSPTGAALRDMLHVTKRRFPSLPLLVYPVAVQGVDAIEQIVNALERLGSDGLCDVAILARGGGSLEDLQAFNDERVARAVAACAIPIVVGVGHESDVSIADFCADLRAPTPSAAAELVTPDGIALKRQFEGFGESLVRMLREQMAGHAQRVDGLERRLNAQHPTRVLGIQRKALDGLQARILAALRARLAAQALRMGRTESRLAAASPMPRLRRASDHARILATRLGQAIDARLVGKRNQLAVLTRSLDTISPLATLQRGYAVLTREEEPSLIRDVASVSAGERVRATLATGSLICEVVDTIDIKKSPGKN